MGARPDKMGARPDDDGCSSTGMGARPDQMGARPFGKGALPKVSQWTLTYWFSIQYPDGVVQVVSTRGVAVSIAGCRLSTGPPGSAFIAGPSGRPVQNAPSLHCNSWTFECRSFHS